MSRGGEGRAGQGRAGQGATGSGTGTGWEWAGRDEAPGADPGMLERMERTGF